MFPTRILVPLLIVVFSIPSFASFRDKLAERSNAAAATLPELVATPDHSAPISLLKQSKCIMVIPSVVKAGFIFGARYGRGLVSCTDASRNWSSPAFVLVGGGSFGLQIGVSSTDLVLVFVRGDAPQVVTHGNFTLGGAASVS